MVYESFFDSKSIWLPKTYTLFFEQLRGIGKDLRSHSSKVLRFSNNGYEKGHRQICLCPFLGPVTGR